MKTSTTLFVRVAAIALISFGIGTSAHAQTFTNFSDALTGRCYDPVATSANAPAAGEAATVTLLIAINSGINPTTWLNNACVASTAGFNPRQTMDTISFLIQAPAGKFISSIGFTQAGGGSGTRGGQAFWGATWSADDDPATVPWATAGWSATYSNTDSSKTAIPVSITTFVGAGATGTLGSASASASNPRVTVTFAPIPTPAP